MGFYNYGVKLKWKFFLLIFGLLIGIISLFYTNDLVKDLAKEERKNVELWADGMKRLGENADNNSDLSIILEVIRKNETVPIIIVDSLDNILFTKNFSNEEIQDTAYLKTQLAEMKLQHPAIINKLTKNIKQYIYYKDSTLLYRLFYYPYIQLTVILIFLFIAYYAFSTSRKAEQNQVWLGMSKETAHQLGTPISSLMAWVEILKEQENTSWVSEMEKDVGRLQIIADRFSKIGSKPRLEESDLVEQLRNVVSYMEKRVSDKLVFTHNLDECGVVSTAFSSALLDWVIENIIKNAIDSMEGKGQIDVHLSTSSKHIHIDISDTGKGISKRNQKRIFSPGYTTKKRGWGLGLSLSKRIVEEYHGGKIFVKNSEVNKGTCFRITLKKEANG